MARPHKLLNPRPRESLHRIKKGWQYPSNPNYKQLEFSTKVLGSHAANMLKRKNLFQTIRSIAHDFRPGEEININLDGKLLYKAIITSVEPCDMSSLIGRDVLDGGFETESDLIGALKKAGFRFKELKNYKTNRIRFSWVEWYKQNKVG